MGNHYEGLHTDKVSDYGPLGRSRQQERQFLGLQSASGLNLRGVHQGMFGFRNSQ